MQNRKKGIICIIMSACLNAVVGSLVRLAGELPSSQKIVMRTIIMAIFSFVAAMKKDKGLHVEKKAVCPLLLRAVFGIVAMIAVFYSIDHLPFSDYTILNKLAPFSALLFSAVILKERLTAESIFAIMLAFLGAVFVIKPSGSNILLIPSLIGAVGGILSGIGYVYVRKASKNGASSELILFVYSFLTCVTMLPSMIVSYVPMTGYQYLILFLCGLASACAHLLSTKAYSYAPAKDISVYDYTQVIFGAVIGYFLFDQIPDGKSLIGYAIVIGAGIFLYMCGRKKAEC